LGDSIQAGNIAGSLDTGFSGIGQSFGGQFGDTMTGIGATSAGVAGAAVNGNI
jgi:hypothetical protein